MKIIRELNDKNVLGLSGISESPPRYTARAILKDKSGKYAVMYCEKHSFYSLPGGGIEDGETPLQALKREIAEKTGCSCDEITELGCVYENRAHGNYTQYSYYYAVTAGEYNSEIRLKEDEAANGTRVLQRNLGEMCRLIFNQENLTPQQKFLRARDIAALKEYLNAEYDVKWIFFDIGSTLVNESECYKRRYAEATKGSTVTPGEFEQKVIEFSRQNKKGDHEAVKFYGLTLPKWHKELEFLYDDARCSLERLSKKYRLGIIANQSPGSEKRLEEWGILKYFDVVAASAEEGVSKPDERIFLSALKKAGCPPQNAVMVGDRLDNDIVPANKLLMKTVWIKRGFAEFNEPDGVFEIADFTVNNLKELCKLFDCESGCAFNKCSCSDVALD